MTIFVQNHKFMQIEIIHVLEKMQSQFSDKQYNVNNDIYKLNSLSINHDVVNGLGFSISKNDDEYAINVYFLHEDCFHFEILYNEKLESGNYDYVYLFQDETTDIDAFVEKLFDVIILDIIHERNMHLA